MRGHYHGVAETDLAMASRAEQKAQARAARIEREQKVAEAASRRRRLVMLGGVVGVAAVVLIVAIVISSSGGGTTASNGPESATAKAAETRVSSLLAGIPEFGDNGLGKSTAPVTVTEYGDLECSVCDEFALSPSFQTAEGGPGTGYEDQLISQDVRTGQVKLIYKSLETASSGSPIANVFPAQQAAAYAAGLQGKGWYYIELFYNEQGREGTGYVTSAYLDNIAKQIPGLNYSKWLADRNEASLIAQVNSENSAGSALDAPAGGASTPTLVIAGPKGQADPIVGLPTSWNELESDIKSVE